MENPMNKWDDLGGKIPYFWVDTHFFRPNGTCFDPIGQLNEPQQKSMHLPPVSTKHNLPFKDLGKEPWFLNLNWGLCWFILEGDSLTKPWFGVTLAEVAIICQSLWDQSHIHFPPNGHPDAGRLNPISAAAWHLYNLPLKWPVTFPNEPVAKET